MTKSAHISSILTTILVMVLALIPMRQIWLPLSSNVGITVAADQTYNNDTVKKFIEARIGSVGVTTSDNMGDVPSAGSSSNAATYGNYTPAYPAITNRPNLDSGKISGLPADVQSLEPGSASGQAAAFVGIGNSTNLGNLQ